MRQPNDLFPASYQESRELFREATAADVAWRESMAIDATGPQGEELAVDAALFGAQRPRRVVVVSSGLHGVEAPLGAAIQRGWVERFAAGAESLPEGTAVLLLHALNPYGFAWRRRFNEDNVDLNRNFLLAEQAYTGAPPLASAFRRALGGESRRRRGLTGLPMVLLAARHGVRSFWETLPPGQYEHDDWLFYGGRRLSQSGARLAALLPSLLGACEETIWLDIHTGLGRGGRCDLLLSEGERPEEEAWWHNAYPHETVVAAHRPRRYPVRGGFGPWLQELLPGSAVHYTTAEFGTYPAFRVLRAMVAENRATRADPTIGPQHPARRRLAEAFAPQSPKWRARTLAKGLTLVEHAIGLL
ncbi:hypothetical protein Mal64_26860 [Pseudobythopirellula maris]|uniref:Succinylglutamate desuccinylase / Aspartoacylase family protein n=1 Tax=Pseudobythopirellula maris TaxID=2527991 RepID=A0A5C5ZJZ8_9BACT|nr:DUF2817 domain-containing protein [Pseudobythopirellula maris]TWT87151.1 hypothetical protein Mal64_26860 [Pseudobythopirellula maris]